MRTYLYVSCPPTPPVGAPDFPPLYSHQGGPRSSGCTHGVARSGSSRLPDRKPATGEGPHGRCRGVLSGKNLARGRFSTQSSGPRVLAWQAGPGPGASRSVRRSGHGWGPAGRGRGVRRARWPGPPGARPGTRLAGGRRLRAGAATSGRRPRGARHRRVAGGGARPRRAARPRAGRGDGPHPRRPARASGAGHAGRRRPHLLREAARDDHRRLRRRAARGPRAPHAPVRGAQHAPHARGPADEGARRRRRDRHGEGDLVPPLRRRGTGTPSGLA